MALHVLTYPRKVMNTGNLPIKITLKVNVERNEKENGVNALVFAKVFVQCSFKNKHGMNVR